MKYVVAKFRVHHLYLRHLVVYTNHASLHTVVKSPHLSQRMASWLSYFAESTFDV